VDIEERTVVVPRKENTTKEEKPIEVWPLVESALDAVDADPSTQDAAKDAMAYSDGCATLANYLKSQAEHIQKMDYRYKVPLLVMAAEMGREDDGTTSIYDPEEGMLYFETDEREFAFDVDKDWTVAWDDVADIVEAGYFWRDVDNDVWALDWLMDYQDVPLDDYLVSDEDEDEV
jgi:hypothetical protein